ncbi:F-actin capping protein [Myriangium duriaei CBS 260.36]|uniref:F-actin-capping protein subunit beta n=1 Tax=Myriangium duriaei CBS 260.36 TaxID=1168546 RepID=A0A9P4J450_9PEZI|nr:F-actin capping protein [Myriangium duriaei CBS 260.36]
MADQFDSALDLLRRLPPSRTAEHLTSICTLIPEHEESLLASVDVPLTVARCPATGRDYLLCDYNRDGDSHRSPWSNAFYPSIDDAELPSERIRKMEVRLNEGVDVYRELYFEGGTGSAYLWGLEDGFAGVVLLKKSQGSAGWDSIHVLEVVERGRSARYKLTSTVILGLGMKNEALGSVDLSGNMTRQVEQDMTVEGGDEGHVVNIGRMVEDMESKMRNLLQEVYFGKAKDVVGDLRSIPPISETNRDRAQQREMINSMQR